MEEFKTYTLEELTIGKGSYGIAAPAIPFNPAKHTYLRITDINDDGTLNKQSLMSVDDENASNYTLKENDIVFARTGNSTGRSYFYDSSDGELVYAGFLIKFSIDKKKVNPRILKYYTHSKTYFDWVRSFDTGGTRGNINARTFGTMPITLPSRETQDKIVNILKSLDDKIELNRRINGNLEQQAQALFKAWFVDFEPFKSGKFVDSELGKIPAGWKVVELGKVTTQEKEKVGIRSDVKVLSPVTTGKLMLSEEYFTKQVFSDSIAKYILVKPNSFAYNPARVNIGSMGRNTFMFDGCVSPVYVVFSCEKEYHYFFDMYRQLPSFKEEVIARSIGGVRQTLKYSDFALIRIVYPPQNIVLKFNDLYKRLLHAQDMYHTESENLTEIRDLLLPRLMSGEIKMQ